MSAKLRDTNNASRGGSETVITEAEWAEGGKRFSSLWQMNYS